jgi:phosphate/sulfate permease
MALDIIAIIAFTWIFSLVMCFSMGANDESMGSAYGSRAFSLRTAIIVGSILEVLGSVLLGSEVTVTIQGKLFSTKVFENEVELLMLVFLCAVAGASVFLIISSYFGLPVSTTHGIVGAVTGVAITAKGFGIINGKEVALIVVSWFSSPVAGGLVTAALFFLFEYTVHRRPDPYKAALFMAPFFYAAAVPATLAFVLFKGVPMPDGTPTWVAPVILVGVFLIILALSKFFIVPRVDRFVQKKEMARQARAIQDQKNDMLTTPQKGTIAQLPQEQTADDNNNNNDVEMQDIQKPYATNNNNENDNHGSDEDANTSDDTEKQAKTDNAAVAKDNKLEIISVETDEEATRRKVEGIFVFLQMVTAPLVAFARGANDVSNGIGPLAANLAMYSAGSIPKKTSGVEWWVLLVGGVVIAMGLTVLGRRVIKSVGDNITKLTPTRGVSCEVGTAVTVLICSKLGIPVSSTHTLVGCVFAVGLCLGFNARQKARKSGEDLDEEAKKSVNWRTIGKVFLSWIITIPLAAAVGSAAFAAFRTLA